MFLLISSRISLCLPLLELDLLLRRLLWVYQACLLLFTQWTLIWYIQAIECSIKHKTDFRGSYDEFTLALAPILFLDDYLVTIAFLSAIRIAERVLIIHDSQPIVD